MEVGGVIVISLVCFFPEYVHTRPSLNPLSVVVVFHIYCIMHDRVLSA